MKIVGIVCEYNPFHMGHRKQFSMVRQAFGPETAIVCAMSGNFVQRGAPAILDKSLRAEAAVACGADLVVELPVTVSLSSAEGFAAGGVRILDRLCDTLCFGTETAQGENLMETARALCHPAFSPLLREELERGISFPAARQKAMERMGVSPELLSRPNDILGVEYCKAIVTQGAKLDLFPIHREGDYHAREAERENPSATAVRERMVSGRSWKDFVPEPAREILESGTLHTLQAGERAVLAKLRTMTDEEFEALPYGSEGLWRKLMHAARSQATLEQVVQSAKSKRYTRTRLDRMVMCAFLGIDRQTLETPPAYVRILAFNDRGRQILKGVKQSGFFCNIGERREEPDFLLEQRSENLYGLFSLGTPEAPGKVLRRRVRYLPGRP